MGFGGENWVSPSEADALKSAHLVCFTLFQLLARHCSIYFSRLAYSCHALEAVPAPPRCFRLLSGQALDQAAQGGGGVPIPGGVKKTCRCGTSGYGLIGMVVLGGWLDSMILEVFSNL